MRDEDLQLLITLDEPNVAQDEDTFNRLQVESMLEYRLGQPPPAKVQHDLRSDATIDNGLHDEPAKQET